MCDRMIKGKDLQPGDLIATHGLILTVSHEGDEFWEGPWLCYADYQDPYHGFLATRLQMDADYPVLHERGTPEYEKVLKEIQQQLLQCSLDRLEESRKVKSFL